MHKNVMWRYKEMIMHKEFSQYVNLKKRHKFGMEYSGTLVLSYIIS